MLHNIKFVRMHSLGNHFLIINENLLLNIDNVRDFVLSISDSCTGIGCDQVVIHSPFDSACKIQIFNKDGSYALACGNATRCLAYLICKQLDLNSCTIIAGERHLNCNLLENNNISVNMGNVTFHDNRLLEFSHNNEEINNINQSYNINIYDSVCADIGNLHLIIFHKHLTFNQMKSLSVTLDKLFNSGFNISFAQVDNNQISLYVWERGVGHTLSCGTAACASFAAAHKNGLVADDAEVKFVLGKLFLEYQNTNIIMTGSSTLIAEGTYYYEI